LIEQHSLCAALPVDPAAAQVNCIKMGARFMFRRLKDSCVLVFVFTATLFACSPQSACAQITETDSGYWAPISLRVPLYKKWQASVEYQPRWQREADQHLTESIVRIGAGYEFTKKFSIFGGAYLSSHFNEDLDWENRTWQQATYTSRLGRLTLQNRLRLEQIEKDDFVGSYWRIRHLLRATLPFPKYRNWYLVAQEEPFFNVTSAQDGPRQGFNQNRLFFGIGRQVNSWTRVEIGYMHQYKNNRGAPDLHNNVLLTTLAFDFTGLKKKKTQSKLAALPQTSYTAHARP
jgi:hypothetical protein